MDRRAFIGAVTGGLLAAPLAAEAQQAGKVPRIGVMAVVPTENLVEAWRKGLRERGWREGENIAIEYRFSEGVDSLFPDFAAEFLKLHVDVIAAVGDPAVRAAKEATKSVPIVMVAGVDPVAAGFVASLARPGGNVTGLPIFSDELVGKQLEMLKDLLPRLSRVSLLMPASPNERGPRTWSAAQTAAQRLGLRLQQVAVDMPADVEAALTSILRSRPDAVLELPGNALYVIPRVVDFAVRNQLPTMHSFRQAVDAGGLVAYTTMLPDLFRRVAVYVDKILKGAKPSDLPVEQPTKFELVINLKTAKALGLTIPPSLLHRADRVIE